MSLEDVVVVREFSVAPERVFDGSVQAETARKFLFASVGGTMLRAETDPQAGGKLLFADLRGGTEAIHQGHYVELQRPDRIVFSFHVLPYSTAETTVAIRIVATETGCTVTLTHRQVPDEWREGARAEWGRILGVAEAVLSEQSAA